MRIVVLAVLPLVCLLLPGCTVKVPAKVQVTDVGSGKTFTTYEDWGKENMLGFMFYDLESGERVMLKGYQIKVLEKGGTFPEASPEAIQYQHDREKMAKAEVKPGS